MQFVTSIPLLIILVASPAFSEGRFQMARNELGSAVLILDSETGDIRSCKPGEDSQRPVCGPWLYDTDGANEEERHTTVIQRQLAAALVAKLAAENAVTQQMAERERLATQLAIEKARSEKNQRLVAALNAQVAGLRAELGSLQLMLDEAAARDSEAQVRIRALGSQLNTALERAANEANRVAELEAQIEELQQ